MKKAKLKEIFRKILAREGFSVNQDDWSEFDEEWKVIRHLSDKEKVKVVELLAKFIAKQKMERKHELSPFIITPVTINLRDDPFDEFLWSDGSGNIYRVRFRKFTREEDEGSGSEEFTEPL